MGIVLGSLSLDFFGGGFYSKLLLLLLLLMMMHIKEQKRVSSAWFPMLWLTVKSAGMMSGLRFSIN